MKVFGVVVNWNGGDQNLTCVASLLAEGLAESEIVLVDNASVDGSHERVVERYPGVVLLRNTTNEGFGHGTNRGIEHALAAGAEVVLLVNNDLVLERGCLAGLVAGLDSDPALGIVGPRVLLASRPDQIWAAGGTLTFRTNLSQLRGHHQSDGPEYRQSVDVDYVAGCCLLVRREVLDQIGLLDGTYFAYHEDLDFCLTAKAAGWGVRCLGEFAALHDAHGSTGGGYNPRRKYMMGVNTVRFLKRHGTPLGWLGFAAFDVAPLPLLLLIAPLRGRTRGVLAKALGTWHGLLGRRVHSEQLEPGGSPLW